MTPTLGERVLTGDPRAIARAISLIEDEDPASADLVRSIFGRTVLLSTHILSEAEQLCDRIAIIDRGRIIAVGTPAELQSQLQRGRRLFVRVDSGASTNDMLRLIKAVPGVEQVQAERGGYVVTVRDGADARPALASAIVGHGAALLELRPLALTLEEMFLEFTTRAESPSRRQ